MSTIKSILLHFTIIGLITAVLIAASGQAQAASEAMVSIRLDDGLMSQYQYAAPILAKYNFPATAYVFTNPLQEGNWIGYMTWKEVAALQSVYGWEIGNHTMSHPNMTTLTDSQLTKELTQSQSILSQHGISARSFAPPFGAYNNKTLGQTNRYFENNNWADYGFNSYPYNDFGIIVQEGQGTTSVDTIKQWIDQAVAEKKWLVLLFHEIVESNPGTYDYTKANFEAVVDYLKAKNVKVLKISDAVKLSGGNLVSNSSFETLSSGWAAGWTRSETAHIKLDTGNRGCYPSPSKSIKITGGPKSYKLYPTNFINVDSAKEYVLKVYFNCQSYSRGGVDVFVDEYDGSGKWLNWEWKTGIWNNYVGYKTALYKPRASASKMQIWIETSANGSFTCYIDSVSLVDPTIGNTVSGESTLPLSVTDASSASTTISTSVFSGAS